MPQTSSLLESSVGSTGTVLPTVRSGQFAELPNGIHLHFASAGVPGRPLVLFLHGFPEHWFEWDRMLVAFAPDVYAVAPDMRGYNLSSQPADVKAYRVPELVADVAQLITALGYEQASVVGHDWGGGVAWQLAVAHPQRVTRLAILNCPHPVAFARELSRNPAQQLASSYTNRLRAPGAEDALGSNDFGILKDLLRSSSRQHDWLTPARLERYSAAWRNGLTGALNYYRASPFHPSTQSSQGAAGLMLDPNDYIVHRPTLILWGMQNVILLPSLLDGVDSWVPDLRIERHPRAGHWLVHEEPEWVAERLRAFLAR